MQSIERRFGERRQRYPLWSDYLCFADAIRETGFERRNIVKWFNRLVDKDDYTKEDKSQVLDFLVDLATRET